MLSLYVSSDTLLEINDLRRASDNALVSNATVSAQVKTEAGVNVGSAVSLVATATSGQYQGYLPAATSLSVGTPYFVDFTITGALAGFRRVNARGVYHQ